MKCFTIVLPIGEMFYQTGLIRRNPNAIFYFLEPYKRGMTPRRLHTVTPKVSGKGAKKKAGMMLDFADMGHVDKKN